MHFTDNIDDDNCGWDDTSLAFPLTNVVYMGGKGLVREVQPPPRTERQGQPPGKLKKGLQAPLPPPKKKKKKTKIPLNPFKFHKTPFWTPLGKKSIAHTAFDPILSTFCAIVMNVWYGQRIERQTPVTILPILLVVNFLSAYQINPQQSL